MPACDIICAEAASWLLPCCICMDTVAASALPLKSGNHISKNTAMNFLDDLNMVIVWRITVR